MNGNIYHIPFAENAWLYPALIVAGIFLLCLAIFVKKRVLAIPGFILILAGGFVERDLAVVCGGAACALGIWLYYKN